MILLLKGDKKNIEMVLIIYYILDFSRFDLTD